MTPQDQTNVIRLLESVGNLKEVCEIRTYKGYRLRSDGAMVKTTVEIADRGPAVRDRWCVTVDDEEGRSARCNEDHDLEAAIISVRWEHLEP